METQDNRKANPFAGAQREVDRAPEESMEDWFTRGVNDIQEGVELVPHDADDPPVRPRRKGIYILPNLFTLAALFSGFYAVVMAMNGQFEQAAYGIFIAAVLDSLDGRVARMTDLFKSHVNPGQLHFMKLLGFHKIKVERAEGMFYIDQNGRRILDFFGGFGSLAFGHNHPRILEARRKFQEELLALVASQGKTFLFVTHSIEEAVYVSDRVVLLSRRPSRVSAIIEPDIPRDVAPDRIRRHPAYLDTVEEIWQGLKQYLD